MTSSQHRVVHYHDAFRPFHSVIDGSAFSYAR